MNKGGNTVPRITEAEHIGPSDTGDNIEAKRVAIYETIDGVAWVRAGTSATERYDYDSNPIYVGAALIGTDDSSTGWIITRYDLSDSSDASGKIATDVSWDDRAMGSFA